MTPQRTSLRFLWSLLGLAALAAGPAPAAGPVAGGNHVSLEIRFGDPQRSLAGGRIEVDAAGRTESRDIGPDDSQPFRFDIGEADAARVRVIWPDGIASKWRDVPAGAEMGIMRVD